MTKILIDRAVVEQALEAFRMCVPMDGKHSEVDAAFRNLRAALAEPEQEPVAWYFEARHVDSAWAAAVTLKHPGAEGVYMRKVTPLYTAPPQQAEPVQEPVAKVELMTTGGNAGLATRIVEIDDHLRERLRPGQLLYTAPPQRKPLTPSSPCEMTPAERKMFKLGWLECEAAHGIGEKHE